MKRTYEMAGEGFFREMMSSGDGPRGTAPVYARHNVVSLYQRRQVKPAAPGRRGVYGSSAAPSGGSVIPWPRHRG
jgi:hypothetical protein